MTTTEKNYYVYQYIRLDNNTIFYIGKGKGDRCFRIDCRSKYFKNILNKTECAVEIVHEGLTEQQALDLECELIHELVFEEGYGINCKGHEKTCVSGKPYLVNATWGGEGISGLVFSEETRKKMSESKKGELNPLYGKPHSEEHRRKLSESMKGKLNPMFGKRHSEESKKKMSESQKGELHPMFGKTHSEETRKKMSESRKGNINIPKTPVIMLDKTTENPLMVFDAVSHTDIYFNKKSHPHIISCCKGKRKSIYGFKWIYKEDYQEQHPEFNIESITTFNPEELTETVA